tara:strand:- start:478 stop:1680 length:1203 start_codon:yes stop_codon:yes gene_type:complete
MTSINQLKSDHKNARKRTARSSSLIQRSLEKFGAARSIVIDEDNRILAGNGTIEGAKAAGIKNLKIIETDGNEIIAVKRTGLSEEEKVGLALADNRTSDLSEWDAEMLKQLSEEQDLNPWFDEGDLAELIGEPEKIEGLTDPDDAPEVPEEPITKEGDLYILGNHRLLCGDSTNIQHVEKLMDNKKADMVFTDPPYGMYLNADYSSLKTSLQMFKDKKTKGGKKYDNVIGDNDDFKPDLINTIFLNFNYCKEIFLWGADYYSQLLPDKNSGSWIVWDKRLDESADKMFGSCFELCWSKNKHKREIARVKWAGIFGLEKEHDKSRFHPTQKPTLLVEYFFDKWCKDLKNVVDLYGGSGSTLIAAERTNRQAYLMELDPKYCDVIVKRWEDFTGNKAKLVNN